MTTASPPRGALSALRSALYVSGALSVVMGLLILIWPVRTAQVAVGIIAIYAILAGLVYAAMGLFSRTHRAWSRVGHGVLGVLFVIAGIVALANLAAATESFAVFIGIFIGIIWIVEGVVALSTLGGAGSRGWTVFFAVVSILAGVVLLFSPLYVALLWLFVGVSLLVVGIFQIARGATLGRTR
ncbi:HdeD family acid-resistance protein [Microbacterium sp. NPDC091313]